MAIPLVLIVAKCNVNKQSNDEFEIKFCVLIVAKCNVNQQKISRIS